MSDRSFTAASESEIRAMLAGVEKFARAYDRKTLDLPDWLDDLNEMLGTELESRRTGKAVPVPRVEVQATTRRPAVTSSPLEPKATKAEVEPGKPKDKTEDEQHERHEPPRHDGPSKLWFGE